MYGEVSYIDSDAETSLLAKAKVDDSEYYAKAGVVKSGTKDGTNMVIYKPIIEYQVPDQQGKKSLKVDGQLVHESSSAGLKWMMKGIKIRLPNTNEVVEIDGHFLKYREYRIGFDVDVKAKKGAHDLHLAGNIKNGDVKVDFKNTLNPYINFKLNGHIENEPQNVSFYEQYLLKRNQYWFK